MSTPFTDLTQSMQTQADGSQTVAIPEGWSQGQSTYGGLTAALGLQGVLNANDDLPPLRSALVNFVGPAAGEVVVRTDIVRQGRSMTVAGADLLGERGLATRSTFSFGVARESLFDETHLPAPDLVGPEDADADFQGPHRPTFTQYFEARLAQGGRPGSGSAQTNHYLWVRFRETLTPSVVSMLALADMPPPAIVPRFPVPKPISTVTWMVNMLQVNPQPFDDGWWLLQSRAEHAAQGYSSQDMVMWGAGLRPVIAGRQLVAIYL